jgi:ABC-2 type transport system ATP-binding protein
MEVIRTEGLTKTYKSGLKKIQALAGIDLSVERGEIFGFLGPNAAGKTTTIKILMHLTFASSGKAWIFGSEVGSRAVKQRIGYLPEHPAFYPNLTGIELLSFYGRLFGLGARKSRERVGELLSLVGLKDAGRLAVGSYSKGMLQRIGMAQSLINDPEVVILDEPLAGVDPVGRKSLRDMILQLKEMGKSVFFSTHILQDVELICDRVAILIKGGIVSVGRLDQILTEEIESIEITAKNVSSDGVKAIREIALNVIGSSDKCMIVVKDEETLEKIQATLGIHGGKIASIIPRAKTLEEHFIEKTRE